MIKAEKGCDIMMVLASNSPRRKELLRLICPSFEIEPADVDERVEENLPLDRIPAYLARKKAAQIKKNHITAANGDVFFLIP